MQKVSVKNLEPGMIPAYNVYSSDDLVLVHSGIALNEQAIKRLQGLGIHSIYINNLLFESLEIPEIVQEDLRMSALKTMNTAFSTFSKTQTLDIQPIITLANTIVDSMTLKADAMIHTIDTRTPENYLAGNAVNVCILSTLTGMLLHYNSKALRELAVGALLHDVGFLLTPPDILNKPGKLTAEEMELSRQHTSNGFEILRKARELTVPTAHVAYQHHENFDGSGYPRGLKGNEIHEYARIVAITNMYDALISDRAFRKGFLPHEAYEMLMTLAHKYLDSRILDTFLANVAIYPIGSIVQLSTQELAMVVKVYPRLQSRPVVKLLTDKNGNRTNQPVEVDLAQQLTTFIVKLLDERETIDFARRYSA